LAATNLFDTVQYPKFNIHVLVAPLDWGLGHATRCIPIIRMLLEKGCRVTIAAEAAHEKILQQEFPHIQFLPLFGYRVRYAKNLLLLRLAGQLLRINKTINQEHQWLAKTVETYQVDWVISDNRYGLWHATVPCTFITHQLRVQMPAFCKWLEPFVQNKLYQFINRYNVCWVPDLPDEARGLSGALGHPEKKPKLPVLYTGWLSRFQNNSAAHTSLYKCLIVLSGPEPQRTILENKLLGQLANTTDNVLLVRGLPGAKQTFKLPPNITVHSHLPSAKMMKAFLQSEYIISRCGYSTLMDAFTLQKKCIFIPTPGQTEQEYLAERLQKNKMALVYQQPGFQLEKALSDAENFDFHFPLNSMNNLLEMAVDGFLHAHFNQ
jgi:uncharacterized protein (TIGR00661 family)